MHTLQIRNIPDELYNKLVASSEESRRSLTQEAIVLLEKAVNQNTNHKKKLAIETIKKTRIKSNLPISEINALIRKERDK
ncbi:MAG: TraY domain-containing protein [Saprospiraceae bacterium]|jgi:plasmid stability protein|nr:hypothetical protein [Saprospiraceae bacterium]MBK7467390.1 hypothetical protein [Saprospiraceae bacterium]MBK9995041.1 hypothetical protein [Saprospiraceae bacterium]